jgi:hypothetical protein
MFVLYTTKIALNSAIPSRRAAADNRSDEYHRKVSDECAPEVGRFSPQL